jgi:hypothetical protein
MDWGTVITSAAVGSIVSSVATLIGQRAERNSRKRELLMAKLLFRDRKPVADFGIMWHGLLNDWAVRMSRMSHTLVK